MNNDARIKAWEGRVEDAIAGFEKKDRKKILRKAAKPLVDAARSTNAFGDRTGKLRASLAIVPRLNRSANVFVGPRFGKRAASSNGYYASMLFSSGGNLVRQYRKAKGITSAKGFNRAVLAPAVREAGGQVLSIIKTYSRRSIQQWGKKYFVA